MDSDTAGSRVDWYWEVPPFPISYCGDVIWGGTAGQPTSQLHEIAPCEQLSTTARGDQFLQRWEDPGVFPSSST